MSHQIYVDRIENPNYSSDCIQMENGGGETLKKCLSSSIQQQTYDVGWSGWGCELFASCPVRSYCFFIDLPSLLPFSQCKISNLDDISPKIPLDSVILLPNFSVNSIPGCGLLILIGFRGGWHYDNIWAAWRNSICCMINIIKWETKLKYRNRKIEPCLFYNVFIKLRRCIYI